MNRRRGRAIGLTLVMLITSLGRETSAQPVRVTAVDLLEYYEIGEVRAVREALAQASSGDLGIVLPALSRGAPAWIEADGPEGRERRRMIAALVAIETAAAALDRQWDRSRDLINWGAALLAAGAPSEGERAWLLAALALCEGARDPVAVDVAAARLQKRFPGEPRVLLARAFVREIEFWDEDAVRWGEASTRRAVLPLVAAAAAAQNHAEAMLRLAYFALYDGKPEEALRFLGQIAAGADDRGHAYLAALFAGWANARLQRWPEAVAAFRSALAAAPAARTATLHLAAALFSSGERAEADRVIQAAMKAAPGADDPWLLYGYGDLRRFRMYVDRAREARR